MKQEVKEEVKEEAPAESEAPRAAPDSVPSEAEPVDVSPDAAPPGPDASGEAEPMQTDAHDTHLTASQFEDALADPNRV